ncbi:MAG: hypothetical protein QOD40_1659 [Alphaproteobacteria bacterium]|jgi:hypothetical protein|nr:hypothetical protein [Alphaproteobacteria bacterium]
MSITPDAFPSPAPLVAPNEIEALIGRLMEAMGTLLTMIEKETALVRVGKLREASQLEQSKADFARSYVADMMKLSASQASLSQAAPELRQTFRRRHEQFHELLRINMTVLATAHAVSEDLIRGVSSQLARKSAPQTYGASGRHTVPGPSASQPLAVSRNL